MLKEGITTSRFCASRLDRRARPKAVSRASKQATNSVVTFEPFNEVSAAMSYTTGSEWFLMCVVANRCYMDAALVWDAAVSQ